MRSNDEARMTNDERMTKFEAQVPNRKHGGTCSSFKHSDLFRHSSFVIRHFALAVSLLMPLATHAQPPPSAKDILASVRMMESRQQIDLQGQLRQDNIVVPFHLVQNGPLIRYSFANPDEVLQLRLGENSSRLDLVTGGGSEQFATSKLKQKIRGTSVTYEDLAFKFLYWPTARRESQYSNVLLWIDKVSGALMRMEGYDWNAQLAKRFEVVSAQKIEGRWFLKQMRIEELQPGTNHVQARTYLEIKR